MIEVIKKANMDIPDLFPEFVMVISNEKDKNILNFGTQVLSEGKYVRMIRQKYDVSNPMIIEEVTNALESFKKECIRFSKVPVDTKLYKESEYLMLYKLEDD